VKKINTKKKPEPILTLADGREGVRRFRTDIWYDGRVKEPARWTRGFPKQEVGSIKTAGHLVMTGVAFKVASYDRVKGVYIWTVRRGERVPGTHVYDPVVEKGQGS
jgi:hypothetical protein